MVGVLPVLMGLKVHAFTCCVSPYRWLRYLNDVGMCLLTDLGTEEGMSSKVSLSGWIL